VSRWPSRKSSPVSVIAKKRAGLSFLRHSPVDLELKERIDAFLTERKRSRKAASSVSEGGAMEVDVN
jgi:hypothetical protein